MTEKNDGGLSSGVAQLGTVGLYISAERPGKSLLVLQHWLVLATSPEKSRRREPVMGSLQG